MAAATNLIDRFVTYIINPALMLIFAAGFLVFMYGLVQFMLNLNNQTERQNGARHMLWGIVGILIMVAVRSIIVLLDNTFQLGALSGNLDVGRINNINLPNNLFGP